MELTKTEIKLLEETGTTVIKNKDELFPESLKNLIKPKRSLDLFHQGVKRKLQNCIAVVGTRDCSTSAAEFAWNLGKKLASENFHLTGIHSF